MIVLTCFFAYIIGSIPFGYIIAKIIKGVDIRNFGSGNIGATNAARVLGKKWGILTFFLDFSKGLIAPFLISLIIKEKIPMFYIFVSLSAIVGHNWSLFLKFKGGKGVATSIGVIAGLTLIFPPLVISFFLTIVLWAVVFFLFRYVSLASLIGGLSFFGITLFLNVPCEIKIFSFLVFIFVVIRHKKNIGNLISKKELRF